MKIKFIVAIGFLFFIKSGLVCYAGMPIPEDIKKVVCFIYVPGNDGKLHANGTGFFISTTDPKNPKHINIYIATAKHVLKIPPKYEKYFPIVFFRLNKRGGGVAKIPYLLRPRGDSKNIYVHNDSTVDLATLPAIPNFEMFDYKTIPSSFLIDKKEFKKMNIREGSDVFFSGMFTPHIGKEKNYPVIRFGRIALLSDERIEWEKQLMELYLIETLSFGGNSGAPVFLYLGPDRKPGSIIVAPPVIKLIGVMMGAYHKGFPIKEIQTGVSQYSLDNMGIAPVVPSHFLSDILFSDEIKKIRGY